MPPADDHQDKRTTFAPYFSLSLSLLEFIRFCSSERYVTVKKELRTFRRARAHPCTRRPCKLCALESEKEKLEAKKEEEKKKRKRKEINEPINPR